MRKLLIVLMMLAVTGCAGVAPVKAEEPKTEELRVFCEQKAVLIQRLLYDVIDDNHELHAMIREDVGDFVPVLFAQFRMGNLSIMLYSVLVEVLRTKEDGKVFNITFNLLDQYIELIEDNMVKTKLFEGMVKRPDSRWRMSEDQLLLRRAAIKLKVAHDLLVDIKKGLEELR